MFAKLQRVKRENFAILAKLQKRKKRWMNGFAINNREPMYGSIPPMLIAISNTRGGLSKFKVRQKKNYHKVAKTQRYTNC